VWASSPLHTPVRNRVGHAGQLWQQLIERARYAADRARQHQLTEPETRLVVRQLEAD